MGPLLLLTSSTLLSSYFLLGRVVSAQQAFTIRDITLSIEPSPDVPRDTNVTLRCRALVSSSGQEPLKREYTIYKDNVVIDTKTFRTSEDLLYVLPLVRVFDSAKYKCAINIEGKWLMSPAEKLTVRGLSKPILHLNNGVVSEGEEVTARCMAPGETGSMFFYFYKDSKEILDTQVTSNQAEVKLRFKDAGRYKIHCTYTVVLAPDSFKSEESNIVTVTVREVNITAVLEIFPEHRVYEGDQLNISCTISNFLQSSENVHLYLSQGTRLLSSGNDMVTHSMVALAKDPQEFECKLEMGHLVKEDTKRISVIELFSVPTLTMSPAEVFQRDYMTLTCKSERFASEKLREEDLIYSLDPSQNALTSQRNGVFAGRSSPFEVNYTCVARAKGIVKHSETLTIRPKVSVSIPKISVVGRLILGQPFRIQCQSDFGSLPINYTLMKDFVPLDTVTIDTLGQPAVFTASITNTKEINLFICEAKNSRKPGELSKNLNAAVIEPLAYPTLTVTPDLADIVEGDRLYLICGVTGTPPVTFKFYREGTKRPVNISSSNENHTNFQIPQASKAHNGRYYCEATNPANNIVRSDHVNIEVRMALWKKAVIGGFVLLVVAVVAVVSVLCYRSKRVRVDRATVSVWSQRPPNADEANDEESSIVSNEADVEYTEVVHPRPVDPARAPVRKGTDTVYSELQNSPHGAVDHHDYGSVEYADLNGEQPEINHYHPEVSDNQELPVPVD
ncbi:uncharacterized protein V6R79_017027 [Siganus canaliculatus]